MNLIIDSGNTRIKFYEVSHNNISDPHIFLNKEENKIADFINTCPFEKVISSDVGNSIQKWEDAIIEKASTFIRLDHNTPIPIKNLYQSPQTLGHDRLAAAIGAVSIYPSKTLLIIDFGTAITYDIVHKNAFLGGAIAPGMQLRFKSLHNYTGNLPLLEPTEQYKVPGTTTNESILAGVIQGIKNEVEGTISSYQKEYSELITVITGGDMEFFAKIIKNGIFAEPKLIAKGLNNILNYNVEKS
ncbi:MAG: pantothenate kinase [Salinivirgaceae bacterium]|nr:MAG: pantothenate kinase [Salinivirgaceae bacterium]